MLIDRHVLGYAIVITNGAAVIGIGVALLVIRQALVGVAIICLGAAVVGTGVALLADRRVLSYATVIASGAAVIGSGIAWRAGRPALMVAEVIASDLGPEVTFLISATDVDKRRSFYKALVKRAEVQIFDRLDSTRNGWEIEVTEITRNRAHKRKLQFEDDALDLFVLLTGGDTRQIDNELEKIDIFLQKERTATVDVVRELVPLSRAGVIFELGNAMAAHDLKRFFRGDWFPKCLHATKYILECVQCLESAGTANLDIGGFLGVTLGK